MRRTYTLLVLGAVSALTWSCEAAPAPVGSVSIEPAELALPYPGFVNLTVAWDMTEALAGESDDAMVFLHLLDSEGAVERTFDHPLPFDWQVGASRTYDVMLYQSALAPPLEAGTYQLTLGLYGRDGERWTLAGGAPEVADREYQVGQIDTAGTATQVPMFYFSPSWLPLEAGTDVQILGRRWLTDEGSIRIAEIPAAGAVWLSLRLSEPRESVEELSMIETGGVPGFSLASTCGGDEQVASGYGLHQFLVPVTGGGDGALPAECEITIRPNFQIVEVNTLTRRSVGLEILSWRVD